MSGATAGKSVQTYVEYSGDFEHGAANSVESGIAISNTGTTAETVNLTFTILNGAASTINTTITLPPGGQVSRFLKQIPGFENLQSPLQGILKAATADGSPNLVASVLRGRYNEIGSFFMSTVPLVPDQPPDPNQLLIIPQIVNGGGYSTSIILVNGSMTPANATVVMGGGTKP